MMSGVDHVKICTSGGVLSPTDRLTSSQFTVPEIKAICDTVRMMVSQECVSLCLTTNYSVQGGTLVTSHCNTDEGARNAIDGGIGGIEHGGLLSDDTLRLMAKKGIHYTPTLIVQDVCS
jgi:imidazolonepropionase-like amidohydrolase